MLIDHVSENTLYSRPLRELKRLDTGTDKLQ